MVSRAARFLNPASMVVALLFIAEPLLAQQEVSASSADIVNISGRATEPDGRPLRGPATIILDFFNGEQSEYPFASISRDVLINDGGVFHIPVTRTDLPVLPNELWLQVTIGERAPLPRQRVLASFFARRAATADSANGAFKITSPGGGSITLSVPGDLNEQLNIILPGTPGEAGQVLTSDGTGKLIWQGAEDGQTSQSIDGSNIGNGTGIFAGKAGETLNFRSIEAGPGINVSQSDGSVTIAATGPTTDAMLKSQYDKEGTSGTIDNAEKLGGHSPDYFTNASNINTGIIAAARIDAAIARDSEIPFKTKSDLVNTLTGEYASSQHGHTMSEISGTLPENQIDPAIARLQDIPYKSQGDLTNALDSHYSALGHSHEASEIQTTTGQMFVSSSEKSNWNTSAAATTAATSSSQASTLAKRDTTGSLDVTSLSLGEADQITLKANPEAAYDLTLPPNSGANGQVLGADGNGGLQWLNAAGGGGLRDSARNLMIRNNPSAPATQLLITADQVIVQASGSDGKTASVSNVNLSLDINADRSDANLITNSWYHIWLTADNNVPDAVFTPSTQPPSSATVMAAYLGAVYVQADGTLIRIFQRNRTVLRATLAVVSTGVATDYTMADLSAAVPLTAVSVTGETGMNQDFSVYSQGIFLSPSGEEFGEVRFIQYTESSLTDELAWPFEMPLMSPQTLYYHCYHKLGPVMCTAGRANVFVKVKGWKY